MEKESLNINTMVSEVVGNCKNTHSRVNHEMNNYWITKEENTDNID